MAQLVERVLGKDEVGGSNPPSSSKKSTSFGKKLVDFYLNRYKNKKMAKNTRSILTIFAILDKINYIKKKEVIL